MKLEIPRKLTTNFRGKLELKLFKCYFKVYILFF